LAFDLVIADSDQAFLWKISEILDTSLKTGLLSAPRDA
jgi:hypothetical protein